MVDLEKLKSRLIPLSQFHALRLPPPVSAVLVPLGETAGKAGREILLTKRTETLLTHKGQVSFPGGMVEAGDENLLATALRETWEEIGLAAADVNVLGALEPVQTRGGLWIYPFVGAIQLPYPFVASASEVAKLIYLPTERLLMEGLQPVVVPVEGFQVKSVGIEFEGELIWGASARMLEQLHSVISP